MLVGPVVTWNTLTNQNSVQNYNVNEVQASYINIGLKDCGHSPGKVET